MEQKPVPGQEALVPPDAELAQRYLDEAQAVPDRRRGVIDRRALAWLQIANAIITAVYLTAFGWIFPQAGTLVPQVILFTFLVWSQLTSGMAQRSGMQWRMTRDRWPVVAAGAVVLIGALVIFAFVVWNSDVPPIVTFVPGLIVLGGLGGYGVVQLTRASRDPRPPRPVRTPLSRGIRAGTILVGLAIGALILIQGAPDGVVTSVILLLLVLLLLAWFLAARSELGLPAIGAAWRWPHIVAFAVAAMALLALVVADTLGTGLGMPQTALIGAGAAALLIGVSFVPGRGDRD